MRLPSQTLPLGPCEGRLMAREWLALVLGALAVTVLVCLVEPSIFDSTDWVLMHSLYKAYIQSSVAQGRLPLWNPHHWLGRPFLADIETAFFYPPEALYWFLDLRIALLLTCALHFLLLGYGAVKLSRALGALRWPSFGVALAFAASAPIVGCFTSGLVHYGQSLCYLPLVLYLGLRLQAAPSPRAVGLLGLVLGLQVLCGHPQAAWLGELGLAVFMVGRRIARPLVPSFCRLGYELALAAVALGLGLGLAAVALLPLAELAANGNRGAASIAFSGLFAEPLSGWATLVVPTEVPSFGLQANAQLYVGLLPLLAGACGLALVRDRNRRALLVLAGFAALLAAGQQTPFFAVLFHIVPGVAWFRIHSRATVLVALALVVAAGVFVSQPDGRRQVWLAGALALLAAAVAVCFCLAWPGYRSLGPSMAGLRGGAAVIAGGLLVFWLAPAHPRWLRWRGAIAGVAVVLTLVDLGFAVDALKHDNRRVAPVALEAELGDLLVRAGALAPGLPPPRVFVGAARENAGMVRGWSTPYGYSALAPGRVWRATHEAVGIAAPWAVNTFPSPTLATRGPFPYESMALRIGADTARGMLVERAPDPRAYLALSVRQVADDAEANRLMRAGHDFHTTALVEQPLALPTEAGGAQGRASIEDFLPERIFVAVETPAPALLVLAEPWFPGWSATVNGRDAPCIPANAWMRAVPVPAGTSRVVLVFHSTYLVAGAVVSLAALAALLALLWVPRWRGATARGEPRRC